MMREVIFVGLPGPTHHYGGLSADNVASGANRGSLSHPREAALQVLAMVRLMRSLGVATAILPPPLRPHLPLLRQHFSGDDAAVIRQTAKDNPALLEKASSASSMWTANAATVAPGVDCADGKLHLSTANLWTHLHRRIEAEDTYRVLSKIFAAVTDCVVHTPLSALSHQERGGASRGEGLSAWKDPHPNPLPEGEGIYPDEGAANHIRLAPSHSARGLHLFIYGEGGGARQSLAASQAIAAQHGVEALFIRQNPEVIAQGVFHNDVIAVGNEYVLLAHELAYEPGAFERIAQAYRAMHPGKALTLITIREEELSVAEAVGSFFFNSQIITRPNGGMTMIAPMEVDTLYGGKARRLMERICADSANPIDEIHSVDLRQSMKNGGGPACLRLRVPMTQTQLAAMEKLVHVMADEALLSALTKTIEQYYPEHLSSQDLSDPALYLRSREALAEMLAAMRL